MRLAILAAALLAGCGGNAWTEADTAAATASLRSQQVLLNVCQSDAGCTPASVRAVEESSVCNLASMLHRHGAPSVVDQKACRQ